MHGPARQNAPAAKRAEQVARVHRDGSTAPTRAGVLRACGSDVVARLDRRRRRRRRRRWRKRRRHVRRPIRPGWPRNANIWNKYELQLRHSFACACALSGGWSVGGERIISGNTSETWAPPSVGRTECRADVWWDGPIRRAVDRMKDVAINWTRTRQNNRSTNCRQEEKRKTTLIGKVVPDRRD